MAKKNKSASYQWKIVEIPIDPSALNDFQLADGLGAQVVLSSFSEKFNELRQALLNEVKEIVNTNLTKRQAEVVNLMLDGNTQTQIAEILNICQTSVHKSLRGNIDYKNGCKKYGGAVKKLIKLCSKSEKILDILEEMDELRAKVPAEEDDFLNED